jgi:hypothetical protein
MMTRVLHLFVIETDQCRLSRYSDEGHIYAGHAFKPLTASRLVPRGARFLVDRVDGFW